jgi:uncharacterized repeat protein (TIGR03803 family)
MRVRKSFIGLAMWLAVFTSVLSLCVTRAGAQTATALYSFDRSTADGIYPTSTVVFDAAGNLYGTTAYGGHTPSRGTIFELSPGADGAWVEKILHNFGNGNDGWVPQAGLTFDAAGNLYGTTTQAGIYSGGVVFELSPTADGQWTEKFLHAFNPGNKDGYYPWYGAVIFDVAGNLYGTTSGGGDYGKTGSQNGGIVFELSPQPSGLWSEKILHNFGKGVDGSFPTGGLVFDATGNLYGTTEFGGSLGDGVVFKLSPSAGGWSESVIHNFGAQGDGQNPQNTLVFDAAGSLYGTTYGGGAESKPVNGYVCCGVVFQLTPTANGWQEKFPHKFFSDGNKPFATLVFDSSGNLFGTTLAGGTNGSGIAFELTPATGFPWTETILHQFEGEGLEGALPGEGLVLDSAGNLYGTAHLGGATGGGTVFEITP